MELVYVAGGVLLVGLIVLAVVAATQRRRLAGHTALSDDEAELDLLARRYARGDVAPHEVDELRNAPRPDVEQSEGTDIAV